MPDRTPSLYRNAFVANLRSQCASEIALSRFWFVGFPSEPQKILYDTKSRLIWDYNCDEDSEYSLPEIIETLHNKVIMGIDSWRVPSKAELVLFIASENNPLCNYPHSFSREGRWLSQEGAINIVEDEAYGPELAGCLIACSDQVSLLDTQAFVTRAIQYGWCLTSVHGAQDKDPLAIMSTPIPDVVSLYRDIDYRICRLPKLSATQFTDPSLGMWEFYGEDPAWLSEKKLRARDPVVDVKDWNIAIDFGTSSSVVAYDDNGRYKLLRIGAKDQWEKEQSEHYENPTILEFIDLQRSLEVWGAQAYRPNLDWDNLRCSHEALHSLRTNGGDSQVVASILSKIKHWALRHGSNNLTRITDQVNGYEYQLPALTKRDVVKGKPLTVSQNDPLDPIELYAWYLGMAINWRDRGLFLRYYMTFPVAYTKDLKETILMSFRRGLQRSLPPQLLETEAFSQFCVEELANEPAAYAAAALPKLGIEPSDEGIYYGVFDFGGGTTDFDFGRYRLPTAAEEDEGWEEVFEHYGNAGDVFLGGENLLENMAYIVFRHNLEHCRSKRISFVRPLDAEDFPGSEMFLLDSQNASTNNLMLAARLRPLWEQGALPEKNGVVKLSLLSRDGEKIESELAVPVDKLVTYLNNRISQGVQSFFNAMNKAFSGHPIESVHVLLAGNSSRSEIVQKLFESATTSLAVAEQTSNKLSDTPSHAWGVVSQIWGVKPGNTTIETGEPTESATIKQSGESTPTIIVHQPLTSNPDHLYSPNGKTGVAIGLLRLAPGSPVKVVSNISHGMEDAPFAHYVGRVQRGRFIPTLQQGAAYQAWKELGVPRERVFNLYHTQSAKAHAGEMLEGESGLYKLRLNIVGDHQGHRVFAKAIGPHFIELCTASSLEALETGEHNLIGEIDLTKI